MDLIVLWEIKIKKIIYYTYNSDEDWIIEVGTA